MSYHRSHLRVCPSSVRPIRSQTSQKNGDARWIQFSFDAMLWNPHINSILGDTAALTCPQLTVNAIAPSCGKIESCFSRLWDLFFFNHVILHLQPIKRREILSSSPTSRRAAWHTGTQLIIIIINDVFCQDKKDIYENKVVFSIMVVISLYAAKLKVVKFSRKLRFPVTVWWCIVLEKSYAERILQDVSKKYRHLLFKEIVKWNAVEVETLSKKTVLIFLCSKINTILDISVVMYP